jgi:hypothetical protein
LLGVLCSWLVTAGLFYIASCFINHGLVILDPLLSSASEVL